MSTNQRSSFRCQTIDPDQQAILQIGRKQVVVTLLDQSVGGFALQAPRRTRIGLGQVVTVRTNMGWSEAEVVHIEQEATLTRIGLRRLQELPDPRCEAALHANSLQFKAGRSLQSSGGALSRMFGWGLVLIAAFWISASHAVWLPPLQGWWKQQSWSETPQKTMPVDSKSDESAAGR
jgi:hypothetical protein